MINRVTLPGIYNRVAQNAMSTNIALERASAAIASGKKIAKPSDDPVGALQVISYRREIMRQQQYAKAAADGQSLLDASDVALQDASSVLNQVIERLAQAQSVYGSDLTGRQALANDVDELAKQMRTITNRTHIGRPLFSGTAAANPAFDAIGGYLGNASPVLRDVAEGVTMQVTIPGDQVFGNGPTGILGALANASAAIIAGDSVALSAAQASIEAAADQLGVAQTKVGAWQRQIDSHVADATAREQAFTLDLSKVEDIDFEEAAIALRSREVVYQATLAAAGRVMQHSLLDFLR